MILSLEDEEDQEELQDAAQNVVTLDGEVMAVNGRVLSGHNDMSEYLLHYVLRVLKTFLWDSRWQTYARTSYRNGRNTDSLYICLQELRIISFSVVNMTEKSRCCQLDLGRFF
jgi:hypothetical protein